MEAQSVYTLLQGNSYPGRGIVLGLVPGGESAVLAYFIMGRSVNSRNRLFVPQPDGGIVTRAADERLVADPSLIIYAPVRVPRPGIWIVTNGDQTDTIFDALTGGHSFEDALRIRTFEPDAPNYTPRISGLLEAECGALRYRLCLIKSTNGRGAGVQRQFFEYPEPQPGQGHFLHTYRGDGHPLPSFEGEPVCVRVPGSLDDLASQIWEGLDKENRISLFAACVRLKDGAVMQTCLVNKYKPVQEG